MWYDFESRILLNSREKSVILLCIWSFIWSRFFVGLLSDYCLIGIYRWCHMQTHTHTFRIGHALNLNTFGPLFLVVWTDILNDIRLLRLVWRTFRKVFNSTHIPTEHLFITFSTLIHTSTHIHLSYCITHQKTRVQGISFVV